MRVYCDPQTLVQLGDQAVGAVSAPCRAWTCARCEPGRRAQMRAEVFRGQPNRFMTLTNRVDTNKTPDHQARDLVRAQQALAKRMEREHSRDPSIDPEPYGPAPPQGWLKDHRGQVQRQVRLHPDGLQYFRKLEAHESGRPHMHVALRCDWIDKTWLSLQMAELLDSPIVDIRKCEDPGRIGAYVAKYMGKGTAKFERCKRYTQTKKWQVIARVKHPCFPGLKGRWTQERLDLEEWVAFKAWEGCMIERITKDKVIATRPP